MWSFEGFKIHSPKPNSWSRSHDSLSITVDRKFEISDFQSACYIIKFFTGHKVRLTTQWEWNFNNNKLSTLSWEESIERTKRAWINEHESFGFCNYSFLFSWLNPHSILLVRVKLWRSKDSCKKMFPLHYLSSILNFSFHFVSIILYFLNPTFHHFCLIPWFYNLFPWSFLLYCAWTQGCFPSLSPVFFFLSMTAPDFIHMNLIKAVYLVKTKFISR